MELANVEELQLYFLREIKKGEYAQSREGLDIPIWILGSSTESAYLAAAKGLPFLRHFAGTTLNAIRI
jgi:alkanesulfonate monooxygenase SsuD/methylene tetrahydromethanopterin reductase-like flavin-dependent oxidoreductase (luciferase family)